MNRLAMPDVRPVLARLGWPGLTGLLLGTVGAWGALQLLPAWRADVDEDEAQVTHLRRQLQQQSSGQAKARASTLAAANATAVSSRDEITPALVRDTW